MNNEQDYRKSEYLNYSGMKKLLISPAHYKAWLQEQSQPEEPERELRIGIATHSMSLEPERFDEQFSVAPVCDRRTNEGKRIWREHLESCPGKMILTSEEFEIARSCSDSVRRNSVFAKAIADEKRLIEKPLYLKNEHFKYGIKGRPDLISPSNNLIVDIKTHGGSLTEYDIRKAIIRNKYYLQEVVYNILANQNGIPVNEFMFVFVEKKEPYASVSVSIENANITMSAMTELRDSCAAFTQCMDTNTWPDLSNSNIVI
jgi:exodeoxyribonuclease VIII